MRANILKLIPHAACATLLMFSMGIANATVNLTAQETTTTLPDGQTVRMWGLTCGTPDTTDPNTCTALNPTATPDPTLALPAWQPPLITVQTGSTLTIALTNNLKVPTSLVIVGQNGGGLGDSPVRTPSPAHNPQGTTWPGTLGGTASGDPVFTPPAQADRVRSFGTEVPPPDATTGVTTTTLTWTNMQPGTYLLETGTHPSIQGPMGLYGIVVVTSSTTDTAGVTTNTAYPANSVFPNGVTYDKDIPILLSEIDPVQNAAVQAAVDYPAGQNGHTFNPLITWSGAIGACGDVTVDISQHWCYPPAVNYSPRYYLMNGVSFDRNNISVSTLAGPVTLTTGNVLLRFVNAGLRMHVPSVVGLDMDLIARDGNVQPGLPKRMSEVFMAAGKTFDMMVHPAPDTTNTTSYKPAIYPVFDRELSLSANNHHDGGMQAYITVNTTATSTDNSAANADTYYLIAGNKLSVTDPSRGVVANDVGVYGVTVLTPPSAGTLTLNPDGTFIYTPSDLTTVTPDSFTYCANTASGASCSAAHTGTVTLAACTGACLGAAPTANADAYTSAIATQLHINAPGVLNNDRDPAGLPMKAVIDTADATTTPCASVQLNDNGSFTATGAAGTTCSFNYIAQNSQNTKSAFATVSVTFPTASGLKVSVLDAKTKVAITDYRWIIEEDTTNYIDPNQTTTTTTGGAVHNTAVNFHTSFTPVVAEGCVGAVSCEAGQTILDPATGTHVPAVCDVGDGSCRQVTGATDPTTVHKTPVDPSQVYLDPNKRYYISILPGDGSNPILETATPTTGSAGVGHTMSGAEIAAGQKNVNVFLEPTPLTPAKLSIFVFEDDFPLNGEPDTGGGVDVLAPNEAGLGEFAITLFDQAGGLGDNVGQITYDEFNMPVSNALAGTIDPSTGFDACPISKNPDRLVGTIITCPKYESDGKTLSPLAGHAVVDNLYAGMYEVVASPDAQRISRGEEWVQTNTLDGTKAIEAFVKNGEPDYFQEFGPGGYHVYVGFANADIINKRKAAVCKGQDCTSTLNGQVTGLHMSRTPDERVYSTGNYNTFSYTQCYVSLGAPDSADFAFTKCDADGKFSFHNIPKGNMKVTIFDQWNDILVDGLSTPVVTSSNTVDGATNAHCSGTPLVCNYEFPLIAWRTSLYGRVFVDQNGDGVSQADEPGLPLVPYNVKMRDGSYFNYNVTDLNGYASFNETFPILNWLVVDTDNTRYKLEGIHVVYDAGGPVDGSGGGSSSIGAGLANTIESPTAHVPADLRFPGSLYCADADCGTGSFDPTSGNPGSTARIDPGWVGTEGWQGLLGQNSMIEFAMKPFMPGENGGIKGMVNYASTRPFDDPGLLLQMMWAPNVPNVKVNLYQKTTDSFGNEKLKLVDTTTTTSWDDFAQGFRKDASGNLISVTDPSTNKTGYVPNMNCPGQETDSPFWFTLQGSTENLNPNTPMAYDARYKCFDGWAMLNQVQPAPINGTYHFPSVVNRDPATGVPAGTGTAISASGGSMPGTNCTICVKNPDDGTPMLPTGDYVVEVVVPPGYELVKEEDKNILLGDAYVAPVTQQLAGLGNIFIMPDQATMNEYTNPYNPINPTTNLGATPRHEGDTGSVESFWPCVGKKRIVPDFNSLYPEAQQAAPFAGATRALCDRKEVMLSDQMTALAKFYIFTSTHVASHFTGTITNDFASEFDPFSPQFGEKFAVPNTPVAIRDFSGKEISRVYSDQWGVYDGMTFSSYTVNPPDPSGYIPQVMVMCMNDPGPILDTRADSPTLGQMITDPLYNPAYSNFCYEWTFMPGQTSYLDTPVIPTMAFADRYNLPDCEYPDTTPAIKTVIGDSFVDARTGVTGAGPWVSAAGHTLTINALGDKQVLNHAYSGPNFASAPFNEKYVTRHYGFGTQGPNSKVTIGGAVATVTSWSDSQIQVTVPSTVPKCDVSNPTYDVAGNANANALCGELVITADNGKTSIDTVTVTVGGTTPSYVTPNSPSIDTFGKIQPSPLQTAIDQASPGDLIIVGPGTYRENLLMWKPVRLQGVGAESVTINADAHPAGKFDAWRRQADCLFGLSLTGRPLLNDGTGTYGTGVPFNNDPSNGYTCPASMQQRVDRIPFETIIGWDTTGNGNLAQQLQEPTLMGAYEGAGITVLGRGVWIPNTSTDFWGSASAGGFPAGYQWVTGEDKYCSSASLTRTDGRDYGTSNFLCNPSRIDGLSVINSSQGGGAIWAHAWNHYLDIANTRIHGNHGTLTGGITIGNGEFPDPYVLGSDVPPPVGQPVTGLVGNQRRLVNGEQNGYGFNQHVWVHNNYVSSNASVGDALYSGTPSAAGGVSFCTGSDTYLFNNNFVCGNLSTGDSGGVSHIGFSNDATIANNTIIFNQSHNPTIPVNAGGLGILGASPDRILPNGTECGAVADADCPPGLPEGTGRNLVIDGNLIMGNSAESGTGGGLRLQMVNGQDVAAFPNQSRYWNTVTITNNIISNNIAGWDGGGVSLQDALKVNFVNNTVASNDTTASAGVLFNTIGSPFAATPPPGCTPGSSPDATCPPTSYTTQSVDQVAGLVTMQNTPNLVAAIAAIPGGIICPADNTTDNTNLVNGACKDISYPKLLNNLFWENRAFHLEVGALGTGLQNQQAVVTLVPTLNQTSTGLCVAAGTTVTGATGSGDAVANHYWDIGVRLDTGPTNHDSGYTLHPEFTVLSATGSDYTGNGNIIGALANPVIRMYCNGSRVPPEAGGTFAGFSAPPGHSEAAGLYPVFSLNQITPAATVDEGNNWVNLGYGPLSLSNSTQYTAPDTLLAPLGNYAITSASPAYNGVTGTGSLTPLVNAATAAAPNTDFFGHPRKTGTTGAVDIGAVEVQ